MESPILQIRYFSPRRFLDVLCPRFYEGCISFNGVEKPLSVLVNADNMKMAGDCVRRWAAGTREELGLPPSAFTSVWPLVVEERLAELGPDSPYLSAVFAIPTENGFLKTFGSTQDGAPLPLRRFLTTFGRRGSSSFVIDEEMLEEFAKHPRLGVAGSMPARLTRKPARKMIIKRLRKKPKQLDQ